MVKKMINSVGFNGKLCIIY